MVVSGKMTIMIILLKNHFHHIYHFKDSFISFNILTCLINDIFLLRIDILKKERNLNVNHMFLLQIDCLKEETNLKVNT